MKDIKDEGKNNIKGRCKRMHDGPGTGAGDNMAYGICQYLSFVFKGYFWLHS